MFPITSSRGDTQHGHEEKRNIPLRKFQMLLRNRSCEGFVGRYQRAQSAMRLRARHEKDVLTELRVVRTLDPHRLSERSSEASCPNFHHFFSTAPAFAQLLPRPFT